MCNFISLVATKTKVFGDGKIDSHEDIIKQAGLKDDKPKELLTFARVEIVPKDGDIFNHNIDNWILKVDEERQPDWWSDKQEKSCMSLMENRILYQLAVSALKTENWKPTARAILSV